MKAASKDPFAREVATLTALFVVLIAGIDWAIHAIGLLSSK
jgi:hypothetical protein